MSKVKRYNFFGGLFGGVYEDIKGYWCRYDEADTRFRKLQTQYSGMNIKSISKGEFPKNKTYVLIHVPTRPWGDSDDEVGKFWKVAKFIRGISEEERTALPFTDARRNNYRGSDVHGNNLVPYKWDEFGPGSYFGQEVENWCELPLI